MPMVELDEKGYDYIIGYGDAVWGRGLRSFGAVLSLSEKNS